VLCVGDEDGPGESDGEGETLGVSI
jgi:hypothetical protein